MVREWTLSLENTGGRQGLKDPLGYKQDITEISIKSEQDSSAQKEMYEKVSTNEIIVASDAKSKKGNNLIVHFI